MSPAADAGRVEGVVELPDDGRAFRDARLLIRVEDVTRADAPSIAVAELVLDGISAAGDGASVAFSVPVESLDPRRSYSLAVHVDVDRDGRISAGDYITTQSYPLTGGTARLVVKVAAVEP